MPSALRYVGDLFTFRHLCWNLVASDLRSRFRRSRLGILWAIVQPLAFSLLIAAVWGSVFQITDYWQFAIYVFSGMIVWEFVSTVVTVSQDALTNAEGYLRQTRIPLFIFQIRNPLSALIVFFCGVLGLAIFLAAFQRLPSVGLHLALIPAFVGVLLLLAVPVAILMSVIGTQFRDVKHISGILMQGLFMISPVMLDRQVLNRPELEFLAVANPVVPLLDLFRDPVLNSKMWEQHDLFVLSIWAAALWILAVVASMRAGRKIVFAL
jgi:lipopolysaccharide transport system permease protein